MGRDWDIVKYFPMAIFKCVSELVGARRINCFREGVCKKKGGKRIEEITEFGFEFSEEVRAERRVLSEFHCGGQAGRRVFL